MTPVSVTVDEIPPLVADLGLVLGLLAYDGDDFAFRFEWFGDAADELRRIPSRRREILDLLRHALGKPIDDPPDDRAWYALPIHGGPAPVYAVLPAGDDDPATIGLGLIDAVRANVRGAAYLPLVTLPVSGPPIVTGRAGSPIEISHVLALGREITAGGLSFTGLALSSKLYLDGTACSVDLDFVKPDGTRTSLHSLSEIRSATARQAIDTALREKVVTGWLGAKIGDSSITRADALTAAGLLEPAASNAVGYRLAALDFPGDASEIARRLLCKVLELLAKNDRPFVTLGEGGVWVFARERDDATDYGLRLAVPDVDCSSPSGAGCVLQVGKLLTGDGGDESWITRSDVEEAVALREPGIAVTLVRAEGTTLSFRRRIDLVSVGLDVVGGGGNPLFDVRGVKATAVEPRFLFSWDFDEPAMQWGAALGMRELGFPLGNGLGSSNTNPVAQSLLASGSGGAEPVNPTFDACAGRVFAPGAVLDVSVRQDERWSRRVWVPVQRAFGPLQCRRVGLEWPEHDAEAKLHVLFDGGVALGPLGLDLEGLALGLPLDAPGDVRRYSLDLHGIGVRYEAPELTISGALVRNTEASPVEYDGAVLIGAAKWTLEAMGSYAVLDEQPSLFLFARLDAELGGPPFFFVTGLCAGFGYNRSLRIPERDEVAEFPLLAGIGDAAKVGGAHPTPAKALAALHDWVAPARGVNWIAAGVQFTSFELARSNVVVVATVTKDFQLAILGVTRIKLAQTGPQFAYAELGLEAVLDPKAGFLGFSAQLSPNSYVLTEQCHLTGGFAFWTWYDGPHAGDFVITLGGYHPAFVKPDHYPEVPRLAFSWQVSDSITIQGNAYFALTPSCAMGGGALDVQFHSGDLRAWFTARADFLFTWKPFYFVGSVAVSVGASYKVDLWFVSGTVSVELGASLEIWGPPTGGVVHVDWYIISFSVGFGADKRQPQGFLPWTDFATLLPQPAPDAKLKSTAGTPPEVIVTTAIAGGLVATRDDGTWLVRGDELEFSIASAVPATSIALTGPKARRHVPDDAALAVRPMGVQSMTSDMTVTLTGPNGTYDLGDGWRSSPVQRGVPASMWGAPLAERSNPSAPSAETLPKRLVGVGGIAPPTRVPTGPGAMSLEELGHFVIDQGQHWLPLWPGERAVQRQPRTSGESVQRIAATIAKTAVDRREKMFAALSALGYDAGANGDATPIADNASQSWPDAPMLGAPWEVAA